MIIHLSILVVLLIASYRNREDTCYKIEDPEYTLPSLPFWLFFGYLAILAGLRSGMNDTSVYISSFNSQAGTLDKIFQLLATSGKDIGFDIFANLFKMFFSTNYHHWFLAVAFIESILFVYVLRRESYSFLISAYYLFTTTLYYNYFSMMRQWLAVSIVFFAYLFLKEKKWVKFVLLCVLAAQFHNSAYLCIPLAFIVTGKSWENKQKVLIPVVAVFLIFLSPILESLSGAMEGTTYDYVIETMQTSSGSSPVRILIALVPVVLSYLYREQINEEDDPMIALSSNMMLLNFFLNLIATFTSGLFLVRMATYTNIFGCILYPYILEKAIDEGNRKIIRTGFFVFYLIFYFYQMTHQGAWGYTSDILGTF